MATTVEIPVRDLPRIVADMEAELASEIEALDAQLSSSRRSRIGDNSDDEMPDIGPGDFDAASVELLEEMLTLINQAVSHYNDAMAFQVEEAATAIETGKRAIEEGRQQLEEQQTSTNANAQHSPTAEEVSVQRTPEKQSNGIEQPDVATPNAVTAEASQEKGSATPMALKEAGGDTSPPARTSESPAPSNNTDPAPLFKGGMLLNLGKERFMRSFSNQYVVVSDGTTPGTFEGIAWYDSEASFLRRAKPIDCVPFFVVTQNSRGSRFKRATVCWPHLTEEDCPKMTSLKNHKALSFFAVDNVSAAKSELIVFAAASAKEREEWVYFLTRLVALYIPPGEEFEPFANMPVGASKPVHMSHVLDGEAPGSAQRVV